ncbi:MAG TPA: hydrogenase iron-sulfur subunit, partial [bacterium (Candidatus Stahlbacteria)]|nr:hydrogenase iron-sulfur subunit [Candidatus Stahlbacteria bacterium]
SRSEKRGNPYCSNYCCMNTVKEALLIKEHHPETEVKVFYMDIRSFGKGFEDLYIRSKEKGVEYIRGIPGEIEEDATTKNLRLYVEDTTNGGLKVHELDLVVLATGAVPKVDPKLHSLLILSKTPDGFLLESHPKLKPVDAPSTGIFFAGCAEYPKDVKDSVTQASAAAARAETILAAGKITIEAITSKVDPALCKFCGICAKACPYNAITVDAKKKIPASVAEALCKGCGTCGAECRFDAIKMQHFTDEQIMSQIEVALAEEPEDKVIVFACNWCSFAGGDTCGLSRLQYPTSPRLIRTMCSGRVDEKFVLKAFELGAPIVLVSGCHYVDCHYIDANRWTQKRVERLWDRLEKLGIRPERLQLEWISAAEGARFAQVMRAIEELRKKVTKEEIKETRRILAEAKR